MGIGLGLLLLANLLVWADILGSWYRRWTRARQDARDRVALTPSERNRTPCILCGDALHTCREHVLLPNAQLQARHHPPAHDIVTLEGEW